ncbi:MAG: glycosyltransferase family 4 protein [Pseudomonadota bacterium]|nr:glycosyltransferase family 4 protein [Pseudomonadota bacterium]
MRILYSHRTRSADGQHVHIRALSEALLARGVDVFMAGPDDYGAARPRPLDAAAGEGGMRRFLPRPLHELAELAYSAPAYAKLARAARGFAPDILYERYSLFHHAGVRLARARRLPFMLEVNAPLAAERAAHGGLAWKGLARASETSLWRAADIVLPVTEALGKIVAAAGVPDERIHVVQNGVDGAFLVDADPRPVRARYGLDDRLVLGFAGFVRDWHGVDRVLRFLAASGRDDLHLLLVGDGSTRAALEKEARALGVESRFTVTGVMQREDMPAHVAAFDIALQPAVTPYASPLKLFEYMALARALVAPASDNIREILADGENALLVPPEDEAALHAALASLVSDAGLRARLGATAKQTLIKRDLTWAGNAARVERLAQGLLERRR